MHLASEAMGPNFLLMLPPALKRATFTPLKLQPQSRLVTTVLCSRSQHEQLRMCPAVCHKATNTCIARTWQTCPPSAPRLCVGFRPSQTPCQLTCNTDLYRYCKAAFAWLLWQACERDVALTQGQGYCSYLDEAKNLMLLYGKSRCFRTCKADTA